MANTGLLYCLLLQGLVHGSLGQQASTSLPVRTPPTVFNSTGSSGSTCPSQDTINEERSRIREAIMKYYNKSPPCSCGSPEWTRVVYLNMSDPNQQCPSNWTLTTTPVRGCGRTSTGSGTCDSVFYPVNGRTYTSVCGRVNAYQYGVVYAFSQTNDIEVSYVSGVSITHGRPGSRKHIWTFAAALGDNCTNNIGHLCPCSNVNLNWPYQVPSFIGNAYFCESGHHAGGGTCYGGYTTYFPDDPLWDGQNCAPSSTCCELNNPPWFCKTLPQPTSEDLEIRQCHVSITDDTLISLIDIYVK